MGHRLAFHTPNLVVSSGGGGVPSSENKPRRWKTWGAKSSGNPCSSVKRGPKCDQRPAHGESISESGETVAPKPNSPQDVSKQKVSEQEIRDAIMQHKGLLARAARALGMSHRGLIYRMHQLPELWEVRDAARELLKDNAESALQKAIRKGEAWAICFFLKCQAKDRGYIERPQVEIDVNTTAAVAQVNIREVLDELERDPNWLGYARRSEADRIASDFRDQRLNANEQAGPPPEGSEVDAGETPGVGGRSAD